MPEKPPLGMVPFLPTHDHLLKEPCHPLCAMRQWESHKAQWGDPYENFNELLAYTKELEKRLNVGIC